jgi:hypothetical protein
VVGADQCMLGWRELRNAAKRENVEADGRLAHKRAKNQRKSDYRDVKSAGRASVIGSFVATSPGNGRLGAGGFAVMDASGSR